MSSFHRPRVYRSVNGCCICGAKSSSSRFTSSDRYEQAFGGCFGLPRTAGASGGEVHAELGRTGDICNACVLLVKRWRKLPSGSTRNWKHVVDARVGGGCKVPGSRSRKFGRMTQRAVGGHFDSGWNDYAASPGDNDSNDGTSDEEMDDLTSDLSSPSKAVSSFLDVTYWKQTKVCCGTIFQGANGEVLLDMRLWQPCSNCRRMGSSKMATATIAADNSDDNSSSSSVAFGDVRSSSNIFVDNSGAVDFANVQSAVVTSNVSFQKGTLLRANVNGSSSCNGKSSVDGAVAASFVPPEL